MTAMLTVTAKNQVTLPVEMLVSLGAVRGDKLFFRLSGKILEVEKVEVGFRDLQGSLSATPVGKKLSLEKTIRSAGKKEADRLKNEG